MAVLTLCDVVIFWTFYKIRSGNRKQLKRDPFQYNMDMNSKIIREREKWEYSYEWTKGNVIYETTNNVHASVLNWILDGTFVCMCLLYIFFFVFFWLLFPFMALCCSSTNMLKRNSSVGKVFFVCVVVVAVLWPLLARSQRVWMPSSSYNWFLFPLRSVHNPCKLFSIVQYTRGSNRNHVTIFNGISSSKNFFRRFKNFTNGRRLRDLLFFFYRNTL